MRRIILPNGAVAHAKCDVRAGNVVGGPGHGRRRARRACRADVRIARRSRDRRADGRRDRQGIGRFRADRRLRSAHPIRSLQTHRCVRAARADRAARARLRALYRLSRRALERRAATRADAGLALARESRRSARGVRLFDRRRAGRHAGDRGARPSCARVRGADSLGNRLARRFSTHLGAEAACAFGRADEAVATQA